MPIYELYCQECGHEFEKIVPFSAATLPACPSCQSEGVGRRMSRPAIHFKGSGWYITDSRKGNGKHSNNGSNGSEQSSEKAESKSGAEEGSSPATTNAESSKAESKSAGDSGAKSSEANTAKAATK